MPEVISLDAVKCEALNAVSLGYYLEFVYSGALPAFDAVGGMQASAKRRGGGLEAARNGARLRGSAHQRCFA